MKKKLIITNYSIKNQVFNGHIPKNDNPYIKSLIRNIKNSKWEAIKIQGNRY